MPRLLRHYRRDGENVLPASMYRMERLQMICSRCKTVIAEMGNKSPVGYIPFGYGPSSEDPTHFYVMKESDAEQEGQIDVLPICDVPNPERRT